MDFTVNQNYTCYSSGLQNMMCNYDLFYRCANTSLTACKNSDLTFNFYLLSLSMWKSLCSSKVLDSADVWSCIQSLPKSDIAECKSNITKLATLNYQNSSAVNACKTTRSLFNCSTMLIRRHCQSTVTNSYIRLFEQLNFNVLPNCSFYTARSAATTNGTTTISAFIEWKKYVLIGISSLLAIGITISVLLTIRLKYRKQIESQADSSSIQAQPGGITRRHNKYGYPTPSEQGFI